MGVNGIRDFKELKNEDFGSSGRSKAVCAVIMATCLFIWLARDDRIFNEVPMVVQAVVDKVKIHVFLWLKNRANLVDLIWHK